jgi:hypothetical protein
MTDASLYDTDFLSWTEEQVAALRALAQRPDLSNAVDWENVIEEIECLGRSEWKGVASQIRNALAHILKGYCDPDSLSRVAWSIKTSNSLREARDDFRNSMREHIDMDTVWGKAFRQATDALLPYGVIIPPRIPGHCPFTLDEILDESFAYDPAIRKLYDLIGNRPAQGKEFP